MNYQVRLSLHPMLFLASCCVIYPPCLPMFDLNCN